MDVVSSSITEDTLEGETYKALEGYFKLLSGVGYAGYDKVYKLLVFMYINDIINGDYVFNATEEDYLTLSKTLECLQGTCLIPYPEFVKNLPQMGERNYNGLLRRTHQIVLRHTEDGNFRTIETRTKLVK